MPYERGYAVPQSDPPRSPRETLPTMYALPSEFPEEPGLPDEFHDLQPQLLSRTLFLEDYSRDRRFTGSDLNIYYDVQNQLWHKRPDWFLALGVPRLYDGHDLRRSYVVWQEGQSPAIVVELLSPRTEQEDLGRFYRESDRVVDDSTVDAVVDTAPADPAQPPGKLEVYEHYLRVPHYIVYSRYTQRVRYFKLMGRHYEEQALRRSNPVIWLADLGIGLGLWQGKFEEITTCWLRWCDEAGNWSMTDTERAEQQVAAEQLARVQTQQQLETERLAKEQAQQQAEQAQQRAEQFANRLRTLGIDPGDV